MGKLLPKATSAVSMGGPRVFHSALGFDVGPSDSSVSARTMPQSVLYRFGSAPPIPLTFIHDAVWLAAVTQT